MALMSITSLGDLQPLKVIAYACPEAVSGSWLEEASQMTIRAAESWMGPKRIWLSLARRPAHWVLWMLTKLVDVDVGTESTASGKLGYNSSRQNQESNPMFRTQHHDLSNNECLQFLAEYNFAWGLNLYYFNFKSIHDTIQKIAHFFMSQILESSHFSSFF